MSRKIISFAVVLGLAMAGKSIWFVARGAQDSTYGPEVKSFLELMRHEDDELEFQIRNNEISRPHYLRAKARLAIQRKTVLEIVRKTGEDVVPEIHVVLAEEIEQLIEDGKRALQNAKRGQVLGGKWRYLGTSTSPSLKGQIFYIFERLSNQA